MKKAEQDVRINLKIKNINFGRMIDKNRSKLYNIKFRF